MKFLGIDYGLKRIGVSLSDEGGKLAFPRDVFPNNEEIFDRLKSIIDTDGVSEIVIGESLDHSGIPNPISEKIAAFSRELADRFKIPVQKQKEFLTSLEARRYNDTNVADSRAAALILQRFLDRKNLL